MKTIEKLQKPTNKEKLRTPEFLRETQGNVETLANIFSLISFSKENGVDPLSVIKSIFKK